MIIKVTHRPSKQSNDMDLESVMLVFGLQPSQILQIDAGFVLGNQEYLFERVTGLQ